MPIQAHLYDIAQRLSGAGIPDAEIEAARLLGHFLGLGRAQLYLNGDRELTAEMADKVETALARRLEREPLAYILGEQEFWSLPFAVSPAVLIPRPETEVLVELALERIGEHGKHSAAMLDLGTGSGVIAITLALELADSVVVAVDKSSAALDVARQNIVRHGVGERVRLLRSDWLDGLRPGPFFDLVVANPPYIAREVMDRLQAEVRLHEPHAALDGGPRGLDDIARLCRDIAAVVRPAGRILLEIGADQGEAVANLFETSPKYDRVRIHHDLAGLPRILEACRTDDP